MAILLLPRPDGMEAAAPGTAINVLVVDDDPSIRALVVRAMEKSGFNVESAVDGLDALAKLENGAFDLLVLDLMMPRLDGVGVVEELSKREDQMPKLPKVLIMTAASPSILRKVPEDRVAKIITKPFDLHTLVESARTVASADK